MPDLCSSARARLIGLLDLTALDRALTPRDWRALARRAVTPLGPVAGVCVHPEGLRVIDSRLPANIRRVSVINFPDGWDDLDTIARDIADARDAGADEIDVVVPWRAVLLDGAEAARPVVQTARDATGNGFLKTILESGEITDPVLLADLARVALEEGADMLKTSTGMRPISATPDAVAVLVQAVQAYGAGGVKVSGGVRETAMAEEYRLQIAHGLGCTSSTPDRIRIGASGLLDAFVADSASL